MSVLLISEPKCTLAVSHADPLVSHGEYADGTDRRTDAIPSHYAFRCRCAQRNTLYATNSYTNSGKSG